MSSSQSPTPEAPATIRPLAGVRPHPTVVRLEHIEGVGAEWISDAYHVTEDVERHPGGLLLAIDELSEFLRSKPDARSFNEDIRFLQFLGERAQARRLWILAAVQEQIEHTGELEHGIYRKIEDRYPLRFLLTPRHVRDLLAECILVKEPGYEPAVRELAREISRAFPDLPVEEAGIEAIYPIHGATIELLEEVRDRFSQARGAIDFAVTRLRGDPARGIEPFLDREWGSLLTPDFVVDHFRDLLELQEEYQPLAQKVLPYFERHLDELFSTPAQRALARRLVKLLVLCWLSPARDGLRAEEAACWLLHKVTRLDPASDLPLLELE